MASFNLLPRVTLLLGLLYTVAAQMPLFSTETGYDLSFNPTELTQRQLPWLNYARMTGASAPEGLESCSPIGSYMVFREATSFPDEADIMQLYDLQQRIRTESINPVFRFLSQIPNSRIPLASAGQITEVGRREMLEIATRVKSRFSELFPADIELPNFTFQSTNTSGSIDSAVAFVRGLVGINQICETISSVGNITVNCEENPRVSRVPLVTPTTASIPHSPLNMDPLLRPYHTRKTCLDAVNKGRTVRELRDYQMGRELEQLRQKIARKLARPGMQPWNISRDNVQLLAKICGFHLAMFNDNNTWCRLFEYEDLNVAEYARELQHYWDQSYGFPLNSRVTCPLINNTLMYFERFAARGTNNNLPLLSVKFTDENTLIRLISLLGIFKDSQQITAKNYAQSRNRAFRSAKMAPFAGNLAINLFRCQIGGLFFNDQTYRVQVLLNERPVNITFCPNDFCDLKVFKEEMLKRAGRCQVDRDCNVAVGLGPYGRPVSPRGGSGATNLAQAPAHILLALFMVVVAKLGYGGL